jgi:TetR/AcrR family transcriptional repressor of lmrAB and yxaGH operons
MTPTRREVEQGSHSRDAFVLTTGQLLRRRGYAATGLSEIVARSGCPRGSLYFHFPGGKEQLAAAAMEHAGEQLRRAIEAVLDGADSLEAGIAALFDVLAAGLAASGYADGCPIATVALEAASESEVLRGAAAGAFDAWLSALRARLRAEGLGDAAARRRALSILAAMEGGLILARAQRDVAPLLAVRDELLSQVSAG